MWSGSQFLYEWKCKALKSQKGGQMKRIRDGEGAVLIASREVQDFGGREEQVMQIQGKKLGQSGSGSRNQIHY